METMKTIEDYVIPVADGKGNIVGGVSKNDLLAKAADECARISSECARRVFYGK